MCNITLYPLIKIYQTGDMSVFKEIYEVFEGLVKYYGNLLGQPFDDSCQELNVFLVELLYKISLSQFSIDESSHLKAYIAVSLKNKYISLSKAKIAYEQRHVELIDNLTYKTNDFEDEVILNIALSKLSEKQQMVIYKRYVCGFSDNEISGSIGISRQAVNRLMNRGICSLRKIYLEEIE